MPFIDRLMPILSMTPEEREKRFRQRFCDDAGAIMVPPDGSPAYRMDDEPMTPDDERRAEEIRSKYMHKDAK